MTTKISYTSVPLAIACLSVLFISHPTDRVLAASVNSPAVQLPDSTLYSPTSSDYDEIFPDTLMLDELTVSAKKPTVTAKGDRVVYNAAEDPSSAGNTVLEMLRKVPLVTVDGNDNITVNGQSDFKIYVNGQPNPMLNSSNKSDILKAMPASTVRRVEVITEPGAKYDAEGAGGILNIVTETSTNLDGQSATLQLSVLNNGISGNASGLLSRGKVTASLNYGIHAEAPFYKQMQSATSEREDLNATDFRFSSTQTDIAVRGTFHFGDFQLSYEPDSLNLFTLSANGFLGNFHTTSGSATVSFLDPQRNPLAGYSYSPDIRMTMASVTATASYQHTFRHPGHNLIASYMYSHGKYRMEQTNRYHSPFGGITLPSDLRNVVNSPTNEHTAQLDYTLPFGAGHTFEAGAKGIFRRNRAVGQYFAVSGSDVILDPSLSSTARQVQDIYALYATATGVWRNWALKGGLRYEYTRMGVDLSDTPDANFLSHLHDVVPNASLTYTFSPMSNLSLSYQMRITRPSVQQLNPFKGIDLETPLNITYGNPDLSSERNNKVALTYSNFAGAWGGYVSAEYVRNDNMISQYSFLKGDILYTTYDNSATSDLFTLSGYLSCSAVPGLRLGLNGQLSYRTLSYSKMNLSNRGWMGDFFLNADYTLPCEVELNAYGGLSTPQVELQSRSAMWHYYGLSFSRSFLKDKPLRITVSAVNFLEGHNVYKTRSWGDGFRTTTRSVHDAWRVSLSISYRFGKLQSRVKQTDKSILNDDTSTAKASSSIGSSPGSK